MGAIWRYGGYEMHPNSLFKNSGPCSVWPIDRLREARFETHLEGEELLCHRLLELIGLGALCLHDLLAAGEHGVCMNLRGEHGRVSTSNAPLRARKQ